MKNYLTLLLSFCFSSFGFSQNQIPKIIKKDVVIDKINNRVEINFDLTDEDNDDLEILCRIYNLSEAKKYTEIIPINIDGDIGYPVRKGTNKNIQIYFDQTSHADKLVFILSAMDREPMDISALINNVDSNKLRANLAQLQGVRHTVNPAHYNFSRNYIQEQTEIYLPVKSLQFVHPSYTCINYEATKLGNDKPNNIIVIDAHYDSASNSPGADDNGSGVTGVLEAIRILSDYCFGKTIRFVFFDLEELGLVGSSIYTSTQLSSKDSIKAVYNFEMIGYYSEEPNSQSFPAGFNFLFPEAYNAILANNNRGDFITNVGNTNSNFLKNHFHESASKYVPQLKVISLEVPGKGEIAPDLRRSDHAKFWDKNIPALMITDGANFRNKNYHTPKDSMNYLNFEFMANVVKATIASMAELAEIKHGSSIEIPADLSTSVKDIDYGIFKVFNYQSDIYIHSSTDEYNTTIQLFDIMGNKICETVQDLQENKSIKLKCQRNFTGIYYLQFSNSNTKHTQKIFINGF